MQYLAVTDSPAGSAPKRPRRVTRRVVLKIVAAVVTMFIVFCGAIAFVERWNSPGTEVDPYRGGISPGSVQIKPDPAGLPGNSVSVSNLGLSKLFDDSGKANDLHYDSDISMQSQNPTNTLDSVVHIVTSNGGGVMSMNVESGDGESATGQFKISSVKFLSVVDQVSALGSHVHKSVTANDASQYSYGFNGAATQDQANNATFYVEITAPKPGLRDRSMIGAFGHYIALGWRTTGFATRILIAGIGTLLPLSIVIVPTLSLLAIGIRVTRRGWRNLAAFLRI